MFKVQTRRVPLPRTTRAADNSPHRRKYPFEDMKIDDWFFVPGMTKNTLATYVYMVGSDLDRKFSTRRCWMRSIGPDEWEPCKPGEPGATQGVGVWRVK